MSTDSEQKDQSNRRRKHIPYVYDDVFRRWRKKPEHKISWKEVLSALQIFVMPITLVIISYVLNNATNDRQNNVEATRIAYQDYLEATRQVAQNHVESTRETVQNEIEADRQHAEQTIEADRAAENDLQSYFRAISDLSLVPDSQLRPNSANEKCDVPSTSLSSEQVLAHARTLSVINTLDVERVGIVLQFLHDANLMYLITEDLQNGLLSGLDLSGIYLRNVDFCRANLSSTNFEDATLIGVNLSDSNLTSANLFKATLHNANLSHADLTSADLSQSDLSEADLSNAILTSANAARAVLYDADLTMAFLISTDLRGADLSEANLHKATVTEPRIDQDTIMPDGTRWTPGTQFEDFTGEV